MKSKLFLGGILIACAIILVPIACSSSKLIEPVRQVASCATFNENNHFTGEVEVTVGGELIVILCSNPSTGFKWTESAGISDRTILKQRNHEFILASDAEDETPPEGKDEWTFSALQIGTSEIFMEYSQPWQEGEKAKWSFALTVVVIE